MIKHLKYITFACLILHTQSHATDPITAFDKLSEDCKTYLSKAAQINAELDGQLKTLQKDYTSLQNNYESQKKLAEDLAKSNQYMSVESKKLITELDSISSGKKFPSYIQDHFTILQEELEHQQKLVQTYQNKSQESENKAKEFEQNFLEAQSALKDEKENNQDTIKIIEEENAQNKEDLSTKYQQELNIAKKKLSDAQKTNNELQDELQTVENELIRSKNDAKLAAKLGQALLAELKGYRSAGVSVEEFNENKKEIEQLYNNIDVHLRDIKSLKTNNKSLDDKHTALQQKTLGKDAKITSLQTQLTACNNDVGILTQHVQELTEINNGYKSDISKLNNQIDELKTQKQAPSLKEEQLEDEVKTLKAKLAKGGTDPSKEIAFLGQQLKSLETLQTTLQQLEAATTA